MLNYINLNTFIKLIKMLPWIEKYRPTHIDQIILEDDTKDILFEMIETKNFPNLLLYGPPGTGKTTSIICLLKMYQEKYNCSNNVMHLNASNDRGVELIRKQIYTFIHTQGMFHNDLKFVVLDEVDSMTKPAQLSLLNLLHVQNVRFCLICNYISKLIPNLRDSLMLIPFYNTINDKQYINNIIEKENVQIEQSVIDDIKFNYYPDLRSTINCLQNYHLNPTQMINQTLIHDICTHYDRVKVKEYTENIYFKDFLIKLFIKMLEYKIDSKLLTLMKELVMKPDFDYFDKYLMPHFIAINNK
jgi:replication factor C subunit 3/5